MTTNEAKMYFPAHVSQEELNETYEKLCFDIKNDIFSKPLIPKLLEAKKERLNKIHIAYLVLNNLTIINDKEVQTELTYKKSLDILNNTNQKASIFISNYDIELAKSKAAIAVSISAKDIIEALKRLILVILSYEKVILEFSSRLEIPNLNKEKIKISETVESLKVEKALNKILTIYSVNDEFASINEWLHNLNEQKQSDHEITPLFEEIKRIRKMYGRT